MVKLEINKAIEGAVRRAVAFRFVGRGNQRFATLKGILNYLALFLRVIEDNAQ